MANFNMSSLAGMNRKRPEQEFIYQSNDFSQQSFDLAIKKPKTVLEAVNGASRIVHVRNIAAEIDDTFIASLSIPFGFIENLVFIRKNNQALLQMREVSECLEMVDYYSQFVPSIYGKPLFIQYSKQQQHQDLRNNNPNIELLLQQSNEKRQFYLNNSAAETVAKEILRILIDNAPNLTINHLVFYKIFSRYGDIVRIVSYTKNGQHHGLVEFSAALPAHVAQLQLNNMQLLGDCGVMRIDFSKIPGPLKIQRPSDKVRDYLVNPLNNAEQQEMESPQYNFPLFCMAPLTGIIAADSQNQYLANRAVGSLYSAPPPSMTAPIGIMSPSSYTSYTATTNSQMMLGYANNNIDNKAGWGYLNQPLNNGSNSLYNPAVEMESSVVLITNLNPEKSNPDALFTLFGVYGDVLRVKVMFNKKSNALVQFPNNQQAMTAVRFLEGCTLWGKQMHLHISKSNIIKLPMEESNHGMTKDYSNSNQHRFKKPNSKNFQNIFAPSSVLHLSNLPPTADQADVIAIFQNAGFQVKSFKYLPNDRKMAMIELDSVENAVHALIACQNHKFSDKCHLRIGFSRIPGL